MSRRFPFPIPRGWYQVAYSDELAAREVRPMNYFDRELVLATTPIHAELLDVRFSLTLDGSRGASLEHGVGKAIIADIVQQFVEDTPIGENESFKPQPIFCDGDGPIARYRKWASQSDAS
ncbi:MAG: hypothetical protein JRG86_18480 [Deltaproteobacteria bacterium]|jgi:hypothetical protein|nr:hypothetical protein [Deltaproteobacteria bacterium]MBW2500463.1 hypothetical protein [Deltaproteobacteria bacterium]